MSEETTCAGCARLQAELDELRQAHEALRQDYQTLLRQHERLLEEVVRLREMVQQDSSNSHNPPSSDGPRGRSDRGKKKRKLGKRGARKGHKGHQRQLLPPEEVDQLHDLVPERCSGCSAMLEGLDPDPHRHQVIELVERPYHVEEWRLHRLTCPCCGEQTRADLPEEVGQSTFGPRLQALCVLMTGALLLSKSKTCELLAMLGITMSEGTLCAIEQRGSAALQPAMDQIHDRVAHSAAVHLDETGWKVAGKRHWLWVATCAAATLFVIDRSRGGKVARDMIGAEYEGIAHSDRHAAYNWIETSQRQICWAHLVRDFRKIGQREDAASQHLAMILGQVADWVFFAHRRIRDGTWSRRHARVEVEGVRGHMRSWLQWGVMQTCAKTSRTCAKLLDVEPAMWTFIHHEGVEPTNNRAERAVRHAVIYRKRSFGNVSPRGARFIACIFSVVATLRQNGRDLLDFLTRTFEAWNRGASQPRLFPVLTP